jgi:tyrosine-protein kinase Etk/Wzc
MNQSVPKQTLNPAQFPTEDNDAVDLASHLDLLIDNRWLISMVALVITLLGSAYAFMATPIYEANILVQVEDSANSSATIMGELAGAFDLKSAATAEIEILRSRFIVARAVNNAHLDLTVEPKYFPVVGKWIARRSDSLSEPGLFGFGGYAWGKEEADIAVFNIPQSLEGERFVLTVTGKSAFRLTQADANIEISGVVGESIKTQSSQGLIEVRVSRLLGNVGAKFEIKRAPLLDTIEELQKALTIGEKGKQSGIIGVSLEGANPERTAGTLNVIGQEYIRQNVERKSAEAEKSLAFLEKQLPEMKASLEQAESKYNALRNSRGTIDLEEEAKAILQQSVLAETRLIELKQKRDELLMRYQDSNPLVQAVNEQMRTLDSEISLVNKKIKVMPSIEQDVLRLTRDVKVNTDLYTSLLNSAQQLRLMKASKVGNVRLLDQAIAPLHPVRPKRILVIILAILIGLFVGIVCAFVRKSLFAGIDEPHEIEDRLGLNVSAAIPFSARQTELYAQVQAKSNKVSILAASDPTDVAIESLRSFRTSLQFSMLSAKNKIVMITGPTPGVGKSFVSANFSAVLASGGKKVLLIDGDIRKGYLNKYFGIDRRNGLSEVISGQLALEKAIHRDVVENVDFLSTGELPPRPAELLGHENFASILHEVSSRYDFVIIDTAPILAVADAMVVAPHVGAIFNIVRGNVSTLGEIEESVKRLNQAGNSVAGIVFNGLKARIGRYGYGSKYGKYRYAQYKY